MESDRTGSTPQARRFVLESRLRYHHGCLREDATDPDLTSVQRLTLVRRRVARMREIERELKGTATSGSIGKD